MRVREQYVFRLTVYLFAGSAGKESGGGWIYWQNSGKEARERRERVGRRSRAGEENIEVWRDREG